MMQSNIPPDAGKGKKPMLFGWYPPIAKPERGNEIAELSRACCDNRATCHGTDLIAVQDIGLPPVSRGSQEPADGSSSGDATGHAHPAHVRYSIFRVVSSPARENEPQADRCRPVSPTLQDGDVHLQVEQGRDYELLEHSGFVQGRMAPRCGAGIPAEKIPRGAA